MAENGSHELASALAQLVQNQARFVAHLDEDRRRFSRIERDLDAIKALLVKHEEILLRHEETLRKLPETIGEMLKKQTEALREKIGFKRR